MISTRDVEGLATLTLSLRLGEGEAAPGEAGEDYSGGRTACVDLVVDRGGEALGGMTLPLSAFGIPPNFDPSMTAGPEPKFAIEEPLWPMVGGLVQRATDGLGPLWLELATPVGSLAVLPWEQMLAPILGELVVARAPSYPLFVPLDLPRVDVVLCVPDSSATPADTMSMVDSLLAALPPGGGREFFVHIFTGAETHASLSRRPVDARLELHDPFHARAKPATRTATGAAAEGVTNPWLSWIVREMEDATAEVVHFVAPGSLASGGLPMLALAYSPSGIDDELRSAFVGPNELAECLAQLGAWGVGFTSPQSGSKMGLRQLFYDVARLRVGPVVHHDAAFDPRGTQLADTYARLFTDQPPVYSNALSMYLHPANFAPAESAVWTTGDPVLEAVAQLQATLTTDPGAPVWATSTRRYLQQAAGRRLPVPKETESTVEEAAARGLRDILLFVDQVLQDTEGELQ